MSETQKMKRKMRNLRYRQKQKTVKGFVPSKQDIEEKAKFDLEHAQELTLKYGTSNESCILFRRIYDAKQEHELKQELWVYYFNHLEVCSECRMWMKNRSFDLNGVGDKKYEELRGYETLFKDSGSPSNMGENKGGWNSICPYCGARLENGECPNKCSSS
jgi:hypothetical protein